MYSGLTLIQSLFLPFRVYSELGCFITSPSPLASMICSILSRTSCTVRPSNSVVNSKRPFTSLMHALRLRLRYFSDLCNRDIPLRYRRSNILTWQSKGCVRSETGAKQVNGLTARSGVVFFLGSVCSKESGHEHNKHLGDGDGTNQEPRSSKCQMEDFSPTQDPKRAFLRLE